MKRTALFLLAIVIIIAAPHLTKQRLPFMSVTGTSMMPVLEEGDLVMFERISADDVEVGDIIIYNIPPVNQMYLGSPQVVAHRVVEIRETTEGLIYRTKGDNNPARDPWNLRQRDIIGKVSQRISYLGFPLIFLKSPLGMVVIVLMLLASVISFYFDEFSRIRLKNLRKMFSHITGESRQGGYLVL